MMDEKHVEAVTSGVSRGRAGSVVRGAVRAPALLVVLAFLVLLPSPSLPQDTLPRPDTAGAAADSFPVLTLVARAEAAFEAEEWRAAEAYAERALRLDPGMERAARILAASRFMRDDRPGALAAWNRVGEPRVEALRVVGLERTAPGAVTRELGLAEGRLLTPSSLRRARRRVEALPSVARSRVRYRPRPDGEAEVVVGALERPLLFGGPIGVLVTLGRVYPGEELRLDLASPAGAGEVWTARWRWRDGRPRVGAELAAPGLAGVPGIWRLQASWERETFAAAIAVPPDGDEQAAAALPDVREERYRAAVSLGRWALADLAWRAGVAAEARPDLGEHLSVFGTLEARAAGDRVALRMEGAGWAPAGGAAGEGAEPLPAFGTARLGVRWRSVPDRRDVVLRARAGLALASDRAPLSEWPGAGTGQARRHLLRAHPLLVDDVVRGPAFGRTLAHGGLEVRTWPVAVGPLRLGAAGFLDGVVAARRRAAPRSLPHLDAGVGVRVGIAGAQGGFRADVARGLRDGEMALSAAWESAWPDW